MAAKRRKSPPTKATPRAPAAPAEPPIDPLPTGPTGRHLLTLRPGTQASHIRALKATAGMTVVSTADFEDGVVTLTECGADALLYEHLDVVVVGCDRDQLDALEASVQDVHTPVLSLEPELYMQIFTEESAPYNAPELSRDAESEYLHGYLDGLRFASELLLDRVRAPAPQRFPETDELTWGLQATGVNADSITARGIRVAILDTGLDLSHPDFTARSIHSASFVPEVSTAQDGHGHGTHCAGTACGPHTPAGGVRRYGVASGATILAGKVLSDFGSGQQGWILAGINWAIQNRATVISLSLGSKVSPGEPYSPAYEQAAQAALARRCLVVAAAGNDGMKPVGSPANCPSVMAVASIDPNLKRSSFSCVGLNPDGGEVNIAAPGRSVFSSVPMPVRYNTMSGTSMATPHVAGIAALWARKIGAEGIALWHRLTSTALALSQPEKLVGAGLAQAPPARRPQRPLDPLTTDLEEPGHNPITSSSG
jgi:subtilisin